MELTEISNISITSTSRIRDLDKAGLLCTTEGAAEQLGVSPRLLRIWLHQGKGPRFVRLQIGKREVVPGPARLLHLRKPPLVQDLRSGPHRFSVDWISGVSAAGSDISRAQESAGAPPR